MSFVQILELGILFVVSILAMGASFKAADLEGVVLEQREALVELAKISRLLSADAQAAATIMQNLDGRIVALEGDSRAR